jgi:hypothetical protein
LLHLGAEEGLDAHLERLPADSILGVRRRQEDGGSIAWNAW